MSTDTGNRLAALRSERGLSQEQLAAQMGVSRQAVSNWERSESQPDITNLLRLSEFYGVTLDDLVGRTSTASQDGGSSDVTVPGASVIESTLRSAAIPLVCVALSAAYYLFAAQPLLVSTVFDLTEMFDLTLSPTLAVLWFAAEVVFVVLPFVLIAASPIELPRRIWLAPLAVFGVILLGNLSSPVISGAPVAEYSGIGGALMSSIAIKADVLSLGIGCALVHLVKHRPSVEPSI